LIIYSIYDPIEFYYITHIKLLEEKEVKIIHIFSQKSVSYLPVMSYFIHWYNQYEADVSLNPAESIYNMKLS